MYFEENELNAFGRYCGVKAVWSLLPWHLEPAPIVESERLAKYTGKHKVDFFNSKFLPI